MTLSCCTLNIEVAVLSPVRFIGNSIPVNAVAIPINACSALPGAIGLS
jgi:hypothetical protein